MALGLLDRQWTNRKLSSLYYQRRIWVSQTRLARSYVTPIAASESWARKRAIDGSYLDFVAFKNLLSTTDLSASDSANYNETQLGPLQQGQSGSPALYGDVSPYFNEAEEDCFDADDFDAVIAAARESKTIGSADSKTSIEEVEEFSEDET